MVNALRITSVVAALAAAVVLLLVAGPSSMVPKVLAGFTLHNDEEVRSILAAPSAVDQWEASRGDRRVVDRNATPLLVQQAQELKKVLDPAPSPAPRGTAPERGRRPAEPTIRPPVVSTQFTVVGTSYQAADPGASFAYIQLSDGKTFQWVEIGDEVGHYRIDEVKPDSVVCWDGNGSVVIPVQALPDPSSRLEAGSAAAAARAEAAPVPVTPTVVKSPSLGQIPGQPTSPLDRITPPGGSDAAALRRMNERDQRARELVDRMRESGSVEERAARARRLISEFRSPQVGAREARQVEDLGRELNDANQPGH